MRHAPAFTLGLLSFLLTTGAAEADLVFDLRSAEVAAFNGQSSFSLTSGGVTATLTANQGTFLQSSRDFGIDSPDDGTNLNRDASSQFDRPGGSGATNESVTITFDQDVTFESLALSLFTERRQGQAEITIGDNGTLQLSPDAGSGAGDVFVREFDAMNDVMAGEAVTLAFVSGGGFSFDSFAVSPAAVPEPASAALLGLAAAGFGLRRRSRRGAPGGPPGSARPC